MDPELARRLFAEGGVLVLLDVPERTEFGIDFNCWSVGPRFKGIKMIPPGLHLVYYWCDHTIVLGRTANLARSRCICMKTFISSPSSMTYSAVNRQGESAPRTSFFHVFERQEASWEAFYLG